MGTDPRSAAIQIFLRSLSLVLKSARLYKFDHERTAAQFEDTWTQLRAALTGTGEAGILLGISGKQLLLDGAALKGGPAEQSFTDLLASASLASVHFLPPVTKEEFALLVKGFAGGGPKAAPVGDQLQQALQGARGIRLNEVRYVAEDSSVGEASDVAKAAVGAAGADFAEAQAWMDDPQKLLQMIVAAEGAQAGGSGGGVRSGAGGGALEENDVGGLFGLLGQLGQAGGKLGAGQLQQQVTGLSGSAQGALQDALKNLAEQPGQDLDKPMLVRLAENLAVRFALKRYQSGDVKVDGVRVVLERMSKEIESLRKQVGAPAGKPGAAGGVTGTEADILDRQFWASLPAAGKRSALLAPEAWCIPPRNLRQFVEELLGQGDAQTAGAILDNYAACVQSLETNGRRQALAGLGELPDLYLRPEVRRMETVLRRLGEQLGRESDLQLESALRAVFIQYNQEALARRLYPAVQATLAALAALGKQQVTAERELRQRIGVEARLAEFIDQAAGAPRLPDGLAAVLQSLPALAAEQLAHRFKRVSRREERERLVELGRAVGAAVVEPLREMLRSRPPLEAAATVGLLSRLQPAVVEELLPARLRQWNRLYHDLVVRQLASGGAPERGRLLLKIIAMLDPLVVPGAVDEIGMSGEAGAGPLLLGWAKGELPANAKPYARLKAIEALGRLRPREAAEALRPLVEAKQLWRWAHSPELRMVAAQVLERLDPEWAKKFLPGSELPAAELAVRPLDPDPATSFVQQRRYARHLLAKPLPATAGTPRGQVSLTVKVLGLGGGLVTGEERPAPNTEGSFELQAGKRLRAQVFFREAPAPDVGFEIVDIELEERSKLRTLLGSLPAAPR